MDKAVDKPSRKKKKPKQMKIDKPQSSYKAKYK